VGSAVLVRHRCATCGQRAHCEAIDQYGNSAGHFCALCGDRKVRELNGELDRRKNRGARTQA